MFRLTREVRFAVNTADDGQPAGAASNSYAGFPSLTGFGHFLTLRVTLAGELDAGTQYLCNIKDVDRAVRRDAIPIVAGAIRASTGPGRVVSDLFPRLRDAWQPAVLERLELHLSPFLAYSACQKELPMVRLSQKFEFSASHRLHNPSLSDAENATAYGKCNNPHGHGHNYEVQVTLAGVPDARGLLIDIPTFERTVAATVVDRFDHKNLNAELTEFRELIPSVENIARVIYRLLKAKFDASGAKLAAVTVWETPKTWCEYSE